MKRNTSANSLTVLPHSPLGIQHLDSSPSTKLSPLSNSQQLVGNLSPGRPPPPPYFPPPPPGSVQAGLSPSSVIQNTNGPHKHLNNSGGGMISSPQNFNSSTWERPIHRSGAIASGGPTALQGTQHGGSHQLPYNNSTSSMSKLIVPPPLGTNNLLPYNILLPITCSYYYFY